MKHLPRLTTAQIIAAIAFIADQAVAYGWMTAGTKQTIVSLAGIVLPSVLMVADAIVHHAYAKVNVAQLESDAQKAIALVDQAVAHVHAKAHVDAAKVSAKPPAAATTATKIGSKTSSTKTLAAGASK